MVKLDNYLEQLVNWDKTTNPEYPYQAMIGGHQWILRINDFPAEPFYTLFIDGDVKLDFDDWPFSWKRPTH